MREVARRIGYTVGTLYLVFLNLDDLIVHLNERTVRELRHSLDAVNRKASKPAERLRLLAAAYVGFALLHTDRWRLVFEHRLPDGQKAPPTYRPQTAAVFALVVENLRLCLPRGTTGTPEEIAATLWSSVHGICILAVNAKLEAGPPVSVQRLVDLLLDRFVGATSAPRRRHRN
jgi:AcrR family transcriptional regulator